MSRPKIITEEGQPVDEVGDKLSAMQSEVLDDTEGVRIIELVPGTSIRVLPPKMWRVSALKAMRQADFDDWAKKSLASTEDYEIFCDVDPTLEQIEAFMKRLNEDGGGSGNLTTSSRSLRRSKSTRKS